MTPSTNADEPASALVRVDHQGQSLNLEWGRQQRGDVGTWAAIAVIAAVICFVCVMIAGALEGSNQGLADIIGYSGLGILAVGGGVGVIGGIRANGGVKRQGRLSIDKTVVETSLRADPYHGLRAAATDAYPQFRNHLARSEIVAVSHQRHKLRGVIRDNSFEVLVELENGVRYVIATLVSEAQAEQIVAELRAHLELPEAGRDAEPLDEGAVLDELRDAVTEYRKGPIIGDQESTGLSD